MKTWLLLVLLAAPASAQFQQIKIWFSGIDCATCMKSLPDRLQRLRGVTSAAVNDSEAFVVVELADTNRVRLEQIRDMIEQDGTKATRAAVRVTGDLSRDDGRWLLQLPGLPARYEVVGRDLSAGRQTIDGEVPDLHEASGLLRIRQP